jgi:hypothetical protein
MSTSHKDHLEKVHKTKMEQDKYIFQRKKSLGPETKVAGTKALPTK